MSFVCCEGRFVPDSIKVLVELYYVPMFVKCICDWWEVVLEGNDKKQVLFCVGCICVSYFNLCYIF